MRFSLPIGIDLFRQLLGRATGKLGGDRPTVLRVLRLFATVLPALSPAVGSVEGARAAGYSLQEMKTICRCGKKAIFNARVGEHGIIREGEQVMIDGEAARYEALCARCYLEADGA